MKTTRQLIMENRRFDAVLAKNCIVRILKKLQEDSPSKGQTNTNYLVESLIVHLKEIEEYIGEANQPSVDSIMESKLDI